MVKIIGVDIGGTKTAVTIGSANGDIHKKQQFPTLFPYTRTVDSICESIKSLLSDQDHTLIEAVGISCGGPLDSQNGLICSPPNLPGWDNVPIVKLIGDETGLPCFLENDANGCALAEWTWGAGKGTRNMIFLTFGTGLGAGLILNGELYKGTSGMAGEVGHIRLADEGPSGYGKKGSWEGFCSGGGLARHYYSLFGEEKSGREICSLARDGDQKALDVIDSSAGYLGMGISMLIDILNPEKIIIGSIFAREEELFRNIMNKVISREAISRSSEVCRIEPAALGESLGDLSALGIAVNGMKNTVQMGKQE